MSAAGVKEEEMENGSTVEGLNALGYRALRELWQETRGRRRAPTLKCQLIRELAWRMQSEAHGGIDARAPCTRPKL